MALTFWEKPRPWSRVSPSQTVYSMPLLCCPTFWEPVGCSPPGSSVHGDPPGKNTRVDCHFLGAIKEDLGASPSSPSFPLVLMVASEAGSLGMEKPVGESLQGSRCWMQWLKVTKSSDKVEVWSPHIPVHVLVPKTLSQSTGLGHTGNISLLLGNQEETRPKGLSVHLSEWRNQPLAGAILAKEVEYRGHWMSVTHRCIWFVWLIEYLIEYFKIWISCQPFKDEEILPEKTLIWKDTCTTVFRAALFITAKTRKPSKCPSTDDWLKKRW